MTIFAPIISNNKKDKIMIYSETNFISAVEQSFKKYKLHGARSTAKLKPIHKFVADTLATIFGEAYTLHFIGDATKEMTVEGKYYPKDIDITVSKNDRPIFCLGIKFVTSNYKQNANNYFENMLGETANIQAVGNLPYAQLIILRHKTPYYEKNETESPSKIETISDKDIQKYLNLLFDRPQAHRPDYLGIQLIDIDESAQSVSFTDVNNNFSEIVAKFLEEKLSLVTFFKDIESFKDYIELNCLFRLFKPKR